MMKTIQAILVLFLLIPATIYGQKNRIAPGLLSEAHKSLDGITNCTNCHILGEGVSKELCLTCHDQIEKRIKGVIGYHSSSKVSGKDCAQCHSEHHGRNYELIWWGEQGKDAFDHKLTGYELIDKHLEPDCRDCHKEVFITDSTLKADKNTSIKTTHLGINTDCISCHVDEHGDQMKNKCLDCHDYKGWIPATGFDHSATSYNLTGKHIDVECINCHKLIDTNETYPEYFIQKKERVGQASEYSLEGRFPACTPCHVDPHNGRHKQDCQECHSTEKWELMNDDKIYDHDLSQYPLRGKHKDVSCEQCHKSGKRTDDLAFNFCTDCHVDEHRNQFVDRKTSISCEPCHNVNGWIPADFTIKQHSETDYKLEGLHIAVGCNLCHTKTLSDEIGQYAKFVIKETRCANCHEDAHEGRLDRWTLKSGCELCHSVQTWHVTSFDHNKTDFKLEGRHRETACLECHKEISVETGKPKIWFKPESTNCISCHDDIHFGQFATTEQNKLYTACERCHTAQDWKGENLIFDHNKDSRFKLKGEHKNVDCVDCHLQETSPDGKRFYRYRPRSFDCVDCHSEESLKRWGDL